jgi:ABC-type sugar transport system ATPase subunit
VTALLKVDRLVKRYRAPGWSGEVTFRLAADFEVDAPRTIGLLGPNGSGKTTLLRALAGAVRPAAGEIALLGSPIQSFRTVEVARLVGVVPQQFSLDFSFTVAEMVAMGRYALGARQLKLSGELLLAGGAGRITAGSEDQAAASDSDAVRQPHLSADSVGQPRPSADSVVGMLRSVRPDRLVRE